MAVKIKLKRMGKIRAPYYRIIVADARTKRDGRAIEEIGKYHPKEEPSFIEVNSERAQHWLSVGAQPTDPVRKLLEVTGDWQKFKGLPGAEGTLKTAAPRTDKKEVFAAAVAETLQADGGKGKGGRRADAKAEAKADTGKQAKGRSGGGRSGGKAKADEARPDKAKADETKPDKAKVAETKADETRPDKAKADEAGAAADGAAAQAGAAAEQESGA